MEDHERLARLPPPAVSVQYDARMLMGAVLIPVSNCLAFLIPSSKIALVLPSGPHPVNIYHMSGGLQSQRFRAGMLDGCCR